MGVYSFEGNHMGWASDSPPTAAMGVRGVQVKKRRLERGGGGRGGATWTKRLTCLKGVASQEVETVYQP